MNGDGESDRAAERAADQRERTADREEMRNTQQAGIDTLTAAADKLATALEGVASREELDSLRRDQDRRRWRVTALVVLPLLALAISAASQWVVLRRIGDLAKANNELAKLDKEQREYLLECTTPSAASDPNPHECFDASQKRTAVVVQKIDSNNRAEHDRVLEEIRKMLDEAR